MGVEGNILAMETDVCSLKKEVGRSGDENQSAENPHVYNPV